MTEEIKDKVSWNKKRIFIAVLLMLALAIGGYFLKPRVLDEESSRPSKSVEGASVQEQPTNTPFNLNIQEAVRERINSIQREISTLNISEIASSSPQVQKILSDIKALEQYPVNQARDMCKKICESF